MKQSNGLRRTSGFSLKQLGDYRGALGNCRKRSVQKDENAASSLAPLLGFEHRVEATPGQIHDHRPILISC